MNNSIGTLIRYLALALLLGSPASIHAQFLFKHDASGNLTNGVVDSSSSATTTVQGGNQTLFSGNTFSLTATTKGSGPITYQWRLNGTNISGATNATFFAANSTTTNAGTYSVVVSNSVGSQTNLVGDVTVLATTNTLYGIACALNQYVAVGENGTVVTSSNLVAWSSRTSGTTNALQAVAFGNNTFVTVGANGTVLTSSNGSDWVVRNSGNTNDLKGVCYGTSIFVAVGSGGITLTSPNGITWVKQSFDYPRLESIVYANSLFVTVGTAGTIWTSVNGTNWSNRTWETSETLNAIGFGNGQFIAVGTGGLILSSSNAITWNLQTSGTIQSLESVLSLTNTFYALGSVPNNLVSANGSVWNKSSAGTFDILYGSTLGSNIAVAVGRNGNILRIPVDVLDHFEWATVPSPQRVNQSFSVTVTAKDAANNTISNYGGGVSLSAVVIQSNSTNTILGSISPSFFQTGTNTSGFTFTPNTDLLLTHVRHFAGEQVSIWHDQGEVVDLLLRINVANASSNWVSTPLPVPLTLKAGESYLLTVYSTNGYYYRNDLPPTFNHGTIDQSFTTSTNPIPREPVSFRWILADLTYVAQDKQAVAMTPTSATLANGTASMNVSVAGAGQAVILQANDTTGHSGSSSPFSVLQTNDLSVTLSDSPDPVTLSNNLTYTITVMNAGPNSATSVNVTNTLPANASFVSANSTQGSCQYTNGKVTCSVGTLTNLAKATLTIVVTATNAGVVLTNTVTVARNEAESILTNNTATVTTYVPPILYLYANLLMTEGNVGTKNATFTVLLSPPSILTVSCDVETIDWVALAGSDYVAVKKRLQVSPGSAGVTFDVPIQGDILPETNELFYVYLSNPTNATLTYNLAYCLINNDDGLPNQINTLAWNVIPSPQRTNQAFTVTIAAKDTNNSTATTFTNSTVLRGINVGGPLSSTLITNEVHEASENLGLYTLGYEFTSSTNLFVTHVRHYFGTKVSLWNSSGYLLASTSVQSVAGEWTETELAKPVYLNAGSRYRVGVYTGGESYFWRTDAKDAFTNGIINHSYYSVGDAFPDNQDFAEWYMVDLRYSLPAAISPASTGNYTNGVWIGNLTVQEIGTNFTLMADDGDGHIGFANHFGVYPSNDLSVVMTYAPIAPAVGSNLVYTNFVMNSGPGSATGVFLTNVIPTEVTFVSATTSQGTWTYTNGVVTVNLGTIGNLSAATVTITVVPTVAGLPIQNSTTVVRNESDFNLTNNQASVILIPSMALSLQLQTAVNYSGSSWRSSSNQLWFVQTNTTHDGISAAQSGPIIHGQASWIGATIRGPGTLSFWWKVSSESGGDKLSFSANGNVLTNVSGEVGWQQKNYSVDPGVYDLHWQYTKDADISAGSDAAWLDQVVYTVPTFYFSSSSYSNGLFRTTLNATNGQRLILQGSSDFFHWSSFSTNTLTTNFLNLSITPPTGSAYRFYRAIHRNE